MVPAHSTLLTEQVEIIEDVVKWRKDLKLNAMSQVLAKVNEGGKEESH